MTCKTHREHEHRHGKACGHKAIEHDGHTDYLHDSHLHRVHGDHIDECMLGESEANKSSCTPEHRCDGHESNHKHGPGCGHEAIPHGDHIDYLVAGHLHSPCGNHCDHHGAVKVA
jgi:hypothetical protein